MKKLKVIIKMVVGFVSDKERISKIKLTGSAISDFSKQIKIKVSELEIRISEIWT